MEARAALLASGVGRTIVTEFVRRAAACIGGGDDVVVDLGCGSGDALALLAQTRLITGIGIDLSPSAVERAARACPHLTWIVANADRRLPLLDRSVQLACSLHGRRNPSECARVLRASGLLLIAVPAEDDLIELRQIVQGQAVKRERADSLIDEHAELFTLIERTVVREQHELDRPALINLLRGTYRGERLSTSAQVTTLEGLGVTLASEVFLFAPRLDTAAQPY